MTEKELVLAGIAVVGIIIIAFFIGFYSDKASERNHKLKMSAIEKGISIIQTR